MYISYNTLRFLNVIFTHFHVHYITYVNDSVNVVILISIMSAVVCAIIMIVSRAARTECLSVG